MMPGLRCQSRGRRRHRQPQHRFYPAQPADEPEPLAAAAHFATCTCGITRRRISCECSRSSSDRDPGCACIVRPAAFITRPGARSSAAGRAGRSGCSCWIPTQVVRDFGDDLNAAATGDAAFVRQIHPRCGISTPTSHLLVPVRIISVSRHSGITARWRGLLSGHSRPTATVRALPLVRLVHHFDGGAAADPRTRRSVKRVLRLRRTRTGGPKSPERTPRHGGHPRRVPATLSHSVTPPHNQHVRPFSPTTMLHGRDTRECIGAIRTAAGRSGAAG